MKSFNLLLLFFYTNLFNSVLLMNIQLDSKIVILFTIDYYIKKKIVSLKFVFNDVCHQYSAFTHSAMKPII